MGQKATKTKAPAAAPKPAPKPAPKAARLSTRLLIIPLLLLSLASAIVILALAGWSEVYSINLLEGRGRRNFPTRPFFNQPRPSGLNGNAATDDLILFSLIVGVVAIASCLNGFHHARVWTAPSLAAAQTLSLLTLLLLTIPLALVIKEISFGGRGAKLIVLESFVIILTAAHFFYTIILYSGFHSGALPK